MDWGSLVVAYPLRLDATVKLTFVQHPPFADPFILTGLYRQFHHLCGFNQELILKAAEKFTQPHSN